VLGLYSVAGMGLRAFSGITIGLGGSLIVGTGRWALSALPAARDYRAAAAADAAFRLRGLTEYDVVWLQKYDSEYDNVRLLVSHRCEDRRAPVTAASIKL